MSRKAKAALLLALACFASSCTGGRRRTEVPVPLAQTPRPSEQPPYQPPEETVSVYSFNIQTFGAAKMAKEGVKETLARIVSGADICAVQEVRSSRPEPVEEFMALLPERYDYVLGKPEGRNTYKEQYWVIYDAAKFQPLGAASYPDIEDKFARDPLGVWFKASGGFDFILINNHISPSDAANEIAALPEAAGWFRALWGEEDIIILGDFNADGNYYDEALLEEAFPAGEWVSVITNDMDTTAAANENTYDRVIISAAAVEDFAGSSGVVRFDEAEWFGGLGIEARAVSDHYPVWAAFFTTRDTD
ncbi:MAG: endonuclease/exonuclease/phosphatase family protein [Treponematales bacterium]